MSDDINSNARKTASHVQEGQFSSGVEFLSKALKSVFIVLAAAIIIALAWFLTCGGSFIVDSTSESVIVLKFGKFDGRFDSGWHWFLPYPVNRTVRIKTVKQTVSTRAFMPLDAARLYDPTAQSKSDGESFVPGKDGYAIMGDTTMLHSEWIMTYRVSDPTKYFLNCMSAETSVTDANTGVKSIEVTSLAAASTLLKNLLDDAVITTSAKLNLKSSYYDKNNYEQAVRAALVKKIASLDIGVTLESLSLKIVRPPLVTLGSFEQFLLSTQDSERVKEEARTYAVEQASLAGSGSSRITADAKAYREQVVAEVKADVMYFKQILAEHKKNPRATIVSLYNNGIASALAKVQNKYSISTDAGAKNEIRLKIAPEPPKRKEKNDNQNNEGGVK